MRISVPVSITADFRHQLARHPARHLILHARRLASFGIAAMLACTAAMQTAHADATLDHIKQSGTLNVGIIVDGGHFGSLDPATQQPLGFNVDLAADLAKRLGVKLQVVSVQPSTRVQFLQQGKVDILIANMEYTPERGAILDYVPTPYYRVGGVAIVPRDSPIHSWEDLRGKPVCLSQGSSYTRPLIEQYGAIPKGFRGASESLLALQGHNCVAAVHDAAPLLYPLLRENAEWRDYRAIGPELIPAPSVIWTRKGEHDTVAALDPIVRDWHRTGWLIQVEAKNGVAPPSPALLALHQQFEKASP